MNIDESEEKAKEKKKEKIKEANEPKDESQNLLNKKRLRYKVIFII
jgi:hypothetical protein